MKRFKKKEKPKRSSFFPPPLPSWALAHLPPSLSSRAHAPIRLRQGPPTHARWTHSHPPLAPASPGSRPPESRPVRLTESRGIYSRISSLLPSSLSLSDSFESIPLFARSMAARFRSRFSLPPLSSRRYKNALPFPPPLRRSAALAIGKLSLSLLSPARATLLGRCCPLLPPLGDSPSASPRRRRPVRAPLRSTARTRHRLSRAAPRFLRSTAFAAAPTGERRSLVASSSLSVHSLLLGRRGDSSALVRASVGSGPQALGACCSGPASPPGQGGALDATPAPQCARSTWTVV